MFQGPGWRHVRTFSMLIASKNGWNMTVQRAHFAGHPSTSTEIYGDVVLLVLLKYLDVVRGWLFLLELVRGVACRSLSISQYNCMWYVALHETFTL